MENKYSDQIRDIEHRLESKDISKSKKWGLKAFSLIE